MGALTFLLALHGLRQMKAQLVRYIEDLLAPGRSGKGTGQNGTLEITHRARCRPFFVDAVGGCNYDEDEMCARLVVPAATGSYVSNMTMPLTDRVKRWA